MHRKVRMFLLLLIFYVAGIQVTVSVEQNPDAAAVSLDDLVVIQQVDAMPKEIECSSIPAEIEVEEVPDDSAGFDLSEEDMNLIALVTMAEAEGESEYGKRLVIDTVLNRLDSVNYPDTVSGVIYQRSQFSSMWNGRADRCCVKDDICLLVEEELLERTNHEVIFFTASGYSKYGTPMFQEGNHYFSSYE